MWKKCGKNEYHKVLSGEKKWNLWNFNVNKRGWETQCAHSTHRFLLSVWQKWINSIKKNKSTRAQSVSCWECEDGYDDDIFLMSLETSAIWYLTLLPSTTSTDFALTREKGGSKCSIKLWWTIYALFLFSFSPQSLFQPSLSHRKMCHKTFYSTTKID